MAETQGSIGYGVMFRRGNEASPEVFSIVGEVKDVNGPDMKRETVDATHSQSPGRWREFISGLRDGGEVSVTVALIPSAGATSQHKKFVNDFENDNAVAYQVTFPNTAKTFWSFNAFQTALPHAMPFDGEMTHVLTFKITGPPTLADGWT